MEKSEAFLVRLLVWRGLLQMNQSNGANFTESPTALLEPRGHRNDIEQTAASVRYLESLRPKVHADDDVFIRCIYEPHEPYLSPK